MANYSLLTNIFTHINRYYNKKYLIKYLIIIYNKSCYSGINII